MQIQHKPEQNAAKPYALTNDDGSVADWFASHSEAVSAMKSTTSARKMYSEGEFSSYIVPVRFSDTEDGWIEALQAKTYSTPQYGDVVVTKDKLNNFVTNFKSNVRGQDIMTDYEHGRDTAKGSKASGTIVDAKVSGDSLLLKVDHTETAKKEIVAKEWKYFSADWADEWTDNDGKVHHDVLLGGALTNRPVAKGMSTLPINFSEIYNLQLNEGGEMNELLKKLAEQFSIKFSETDDPTELQNKVFAEIIKLGETNTTLKGEVATLTEEVAPLRQLKEVTEGKKAFSEMFPEEFKMQQDLIKKDRERDSIAFSEGVSTKRFKSITSEKDDSGNPVSIETTKGLSGLCLDMVKDTHRKFAEGTVEVGDFEKTVNAILDGGIVDYGEVGTKNPGTTGDSDAQPANGSTALDIRTAFAEKVIEIQNEDPKKEMTFSEALPIAAKKFPKLAEAYGRS